MKKYQNLIFSICLKLTGDYFVSEDITQETFISVYQKYHQFDGDNEKAWICRIASNKCIDYLRKQQNVMEEVFNEEIAIPIVSDPIGIFETSEVMAQVRGKCADLPKDYAQISQMYFVEGFSAKEISLKLEMKLKTVQTKIYRAREMLKMTIRREDLLE